MTYTELMGLDLQDHGTLCKTDLFLFGEFLLEREYVILFPEHFRDRHGNCTSVNMILESNTQPNVSPVAVTIIFGDGICMVCVKSLFIMILESNNARILDIITLIYCYSYTLFTEWRWQLQGFFK